MYMREDHNRINSFTEKLLTEVEELAERMNIEQIGDYLSCSSADLNYIIATQPEVLKRYKRGASRGIDKVTKKLMSKIDSGCSRSIDLYLKCRAGWNDNKSNIIENKEDSKSEDYDNIDSETRNLIYNMLSSNLRLSEEDKKLLNNIIDTNNRSFK